MQLRRIMASLAVGLLATAGFATGASAAPPPNKPVVTAEVISQDGATTEIDYTVNRGAKQIASVTHSLNGGDPVAVSAPPAGKSSSTGSFDVTAAEGDNVLTVTVTLTDGGSATSNQVTFAFNPTVEPTLRMDFLYTPGDRVWTGLITGAGLAPSATVTAEFVFTGGSPGSAMLGTVAGDGTFTYSWGATTCSLLTSFVVVSTTAGGNPISQTYTTFPC
jgi:hypothetical protein